MNTEQKLAALRNLLQALGGVGLILFPTLITADQLSEAVGYTMTIVSAGTSLSTFVWDIIGKSNKNLVAATNALPEVKGVVTQPTAAGRELAAAVPGQSVAPAGSADAQQIAK